MKVYIGSPVKWWKNPRVLLVPFTWFMSKEDFKESLIRFDETALGRWMRKSDFYEKQAVFVKIDGYDTWSADSTLSHIIYPLLLKLKEQKQGIPYVADEDVPAELQETVVPSFDQDNYDEIEAKWNYVLGELIWVFSEISKGKPGQAGVYLEDGEYETVPFGDILDEDGNPCYYENMCVKEPVTDREGLEAYDKRITNGLALFGKYYQSLWT